MAPGTSILKSELPTDQASILRDLANEAGTADTAYVTDGGVEDSDPNGADSNFDYLFEDDEDDTYPIAGLETSFQENLDDPAALLESLANYEPLPSPVVESRAPPVLNDLDHFESLLQAAATAEGAHAAEDDRSQVGYNFALPDQSNTYEYFKRSFDPIDESNKRKRGREDWPDDDADMLIRDTSKHHKKSKGLRENEDQLALERDLWAAWEEEEEYEDGTPTPERHVPPVTAADTRAAGLHSATALFRRPSAASKKYTRAPMSKLFASLELTAEQFLHLQAAAKTYMLDPRHPERSNCVGNRGRADTDMLKLKLFACVESFLDDGGWGERYFTEDIEGGNFRKLKWPQMKNKIIALVTPLMRRMVTNERQRVYALEARQEKRSRGPAARQARTSETSTEEGTPQPSPTGIGSVTPAQYPMIDPSLNGFQYDFSYHAKQNVQTNGVAEQGASMPKDVSEDGVAINYLVNLMHHGRRVHPELKLTPSSCPGFASLVQHIHNMMFGITQGQQPSSIKVLGPTGLVGVHDDGSWRGAVASVLQTEWLDGEVKCVVQLVDVAS